MWPEAVNMVSETCAATLEVAKEGGELHGGRGYPRSFFLVSRQDSKHFSTGLYRLEGPLVDGGNVALWQLAGRSIAGAEGDRRKTRKVREASPCGADAHRG